MIITLMLTTRLSTYITYQLIKFAQQIFEISLIGYFGNNLNNCIYDNHHGEYGYDEYDDHHDEHDDDDNEGVSIFLQVIFLILMLILMIILINFDDDNGNAGGSICRCTQRQKIVCNIKASFQ